MIDRAKLRAWYWHRQGLDGSLQGASAAQVLSDAGWARSVGGVSPYLTLFSRAGITREQADAAAKNLQIHELPSARGCTYVLPAEDFALGLAAGHAFQGEQKMALKLGVTEKEIAKLSDAVLAALEKGPLDPDGIRQACGKFVRNLGDEGKKKGLTTTLPVALEKLQASGDIRRVPVNGRFDQQRYQYALWRPNPLRAFKLSPYEVETELARRYFSWIGPASLSGFQTFSGLGVKAAKAAIEPLKLEAIQVAPGDERLFLPSERAKFDAFKAPKEAKYALLGSIDSLFLLPDLPDAKDLPSHAIVDRGRLIGQWEYDPEPNPLSGRALSKRTKPSRTQSRARRILSAISSATPDLLVSTAPKAARRASRPCANRRPALDHSGKPFYNQSSRGSLTRVT